MKDGTATYVVLGLFVVLLAMAIVYLLSKKGRRRAPVTTTVVEEESDTPFWDLVGDAFSSFKLGDMV